MRLVGEGEGVVDIVIAYLGAAEGGEVGAGAQCFADVLCEGADVGAGAAVDFDL